MTFKTLTQQVSKNAQDHPEALAIRQRKGNDWETYNWRDFFERIQDVGTGLLDLGVKPGDHIAINSNNRVEWLLAQHGAGSIGAVTVGLYPTNPPNEASYVLNHSDSVVVVCEDEAQANKVLYIKDELPLLRKIIVMVPTDIIAAHPDVVTFEALMASGKELRSKYQATIDETIALQSLNDKALIVYTSGSTGKPKGAVLNYLNLAAEGLSAAAHLKISSTDSCISYLPLCHVAEQTISVLMSTYAASQTSFGESLATLEDDIREVAPTFFLGVPRVWAKLQSSAMIRLAENPAMRSLFDQAEAVCKEFCTVSPENRTPEQNATFAEWDDKIFKVMRDNLGFGQLRAPLTGSAPIPPETVEFFRTIGVPILEAYGLTESTAIATIQRPDRMERGSVGEAIPGLELRLGEEDELLMKGDTIFVEYYKDAEKTRAALKDGWFHTGDVAKIKDGQVWIVDRLKDIMITAGGKNIAPTAVEQAIKASPYIKECISIGEGRHFVSALILMDFPIVQGWAEERGVKLDSLAVASKNGSVRALLEAEVKTGNLQLARVASIRKFHLLQKELSHNDGEVTATMKVRRAEIEKIYSDEIEALYAD